MNEERTECDCDECAAACRNKPGWFLPGEAERAAAHLGVPLMQFFRESLGVDWFENDVDEPPTFVLAPALTCMEPGTEYPGDPSGRCVFLTAEGRCAIHAAKPYECAVFLHGQSRDETNDRHERVAAAWKAHQQHITDLLGREPVDEPYIGGLFGGLFGPWS